LMVAAYQTLNCTNPNVTTSCWLCYDIRPPFYEGIALNTSFSMSSQPNPIQCKWKEKWVGITLQQVRGRGTCLGKVPPSRKDFCSLQIERLNKAHHKWVIPEQGGWWICSRTGLTPCLALEVFDETSEFCIQISVVPIVLYHQEEDMYRYWDNKEHSIKKREPLTVLTIATLIGLGVTGTATGITSLVGQQQGLTSLQAAVDKDLERIEKSISYLEKSLTSLSEVVLQNRRGMDLLFSQQGGLCAALGEECCFYADHTGVVLDSLAKVREGLAQRKRKREAQQGGFESWFNQSPWLTTLLSTLLGPLIVLLIALTFGPRILNKLITFVKGRIETVQLMVLRQQ
ncbi:hypothetical protein N320_03048, partial [Buceros rhinoceros silvestris]